MNFNHKTVLLDESVESLNIDPDGIYVDGTLGGGGHSIEIAKKLEGGMLIGIDQDNNALTKAKTVLKEYEDKVVFVKDNFRNIKKILFDHNIEGIDGMLLDLGVSSHQLDEDYRGFSYKKDSKLDMRMDISSKFTAWDVVNKYSKEDLIDVLKNYGEERWGDRIAEFICEQRKEKPIDTTLELVEVIKKAVPLGARKEGGHPARKTFQGIRIEVNDELEIIKKTIVDCFSIMKKRGRMSIITFHSLEDRIVKETFKELEKSCICPPKMPICNCGKKKEIKIITKKPIVPSIEELEVNHRARSAKLRVAEKI